MCFTLNKLLFFLMFLGSCKTKVHHGLFETWCSKTIVLIMNLNHLLGDLLLDVYSVWKSLKNLWISETIWKSQKNLWISLNCWWRQPMANPTPYKNIVGFGYDFPMYYLGGVHHEPHPSEKLSPVQPSPAQPAKQPAWPSQAQPSRPARQPAAASWFHQKPQFVLELDIAWNEACLDYGGPSGAHDEKLAALMLRPWRKQDFSIRL